MLLRNHADLVRQMDINHERLQVSVTSYPLQTVKRAAVDKVHRAEEMPHGVSRNRVLAKYFVQPCSL